MSVCTTTCNPDVPADQTESSRWGWGLFHWHDEHNKGARRSQSIKTPVSFFSTTPLHIWRTKLKVCRDTQASKRCVNSAKGSMSKLARVHSCLGRKVGPAIPWPEFKTCVCMDLEDLLQTCALPLIPKPIVIVKRWYLPTEAFKLLIEYTSVVQMK